MRSVRMQTYQISGFFVDRKKADNLKQPASSQKQLGIGAYKMLL